MALRRAGAEFVGTFVLVLGGVGAAVIAGEQIGNLGVAFAFGLSLLAMAYAIVAAGVLLIIASARKGGYDASELGFGANGYGDHSPGGYNLGGAFLAEVILTAFLIFTVLAATDRLANVAFAGIPIGLVLVLIHLVGIPITNTSVNPARSIGPALFVGGWALEQLWLFIVAPLVGALLGAGVHMALFKDASAVEPAESAVASETARFKQPA